MYSERLDFIESSFNNAFSPKGYIKEWPVKVSSRIDPSVDFVGSKISPLKHLIINDNINPNGHYLIQDCLRTKQLQKLKTTEPSEFGSCFRTMGTLTPPHIERVVYDTFDYLTHSLEIKPDDLRIRISTDDPELMLAVKSVAGNIKREEDSVEGTYSHKYGLDDYGIYGRDFDIAIRRTGTDEFMNIATVVLMEQSTNKIAVDMGISSLALSMCQFGETNSLAVSRMADIYKIDRIEKQRLADAMITLALLQKENVHNLPKTDRRAKNFRWKYNKYEDAVVFWKTKLGLDDEQVLEYMQRYIELEFKDNRYKSEATWKK